jgi:DNA-binding NarL/FixJ family response regulator
VARPGEATSANRYNNEGIDMTMKGRQIRILTVDDHPFLRDGVAAVIDNQEDMIMVAEATTGREAIQSFQAHQPDITLMDLRLPDMSGIDAITEIRRSSPNAKIVVLTTYRGDVQAVRAFRAGASGYLLKSMLRKDLLDTIRQVHAGRRRIPQEIAAEMAEYASDDSLTARELEVLREVAMGNANKMIAVRLLITEDTVKAHVKSILGKLDANDRTHAVTIAIRRGFLEM